MAATVLKNFIAASVGAWGRGETIAEAKKAMYSYGPHAQKNDPITVFASDKPLHVETDVWLRVYAEPGALLVRFEV